MNERYALLAAVVAFFALGFVLPLVRLWVRTGVFGLVLEKTPVQRVIGVHLAVAIAAIFVFGLVFALAGPGPLCVYASPSKPLGWALVALGFLVLAIAQWQMGASWRIGIDDRPTEL